MFNSRLALINKRLCSSLIKQKSPIFEKIAKSEVAGTLFGWKEHQWGIRFIGGLIGGTIFSQYMIIRGNNNIFYSIKETLPMNILGSVCTTDPNIFYSTKETLPMNILGSIVQTFIFAGIGAVTTVILPVSFVFIPGIASICYRHYNMVKY